MMMSSVVIIRNKRHSYRIGIRSSSVVITRNNYSTLKGLPRSRQSISLGVF